MGPNDTAGSDKAALAASFSRAAAEYNRGRPSYPLEAVQWLVPRTARHVLDLGAGTGKLTGILVELGLDVVAVDPSAEMLEQLEATVTDATSAVGTAENIPLPDASVDAVLVAQAWHWVDPALALPEVARVLRPGGALGLIWNVRDESVPWVARLTEIMHGSTAEEFLRGPDIPAGPFAAAEREEFEWELSFDRHKLLDLVASRSYFITRTPDEQRATLAAVETMLDTDPDLAGSTEWLMPYKTVCFRMSLR